MIILVFNMVLATLVFNMVLATLVFNMVLATLVFEMVLATLVFDLRFELFHHKSEYLDIMGIFHDFFDFPLIHNGYYFIDLYFIHFLLAIDHFNNIINTVGFIDEALTYHSTVPSIILT